MVFENGVKNIQAAAYNGTRTVRKSSFTLLVLLQTIETQKLCNYSHNNKQKKNYNQISEKRRAVVKLWIAPRFVSVTISTVMRVNYYRTRQVKQNKKGHSIIKFFSNTQS